MVTNEQKVRIGQLLRDEFAALGSWKRVATRVESNEVHVRYNMQEQAKWHNVSDKRWVKVGSLLGLNFASQPWQLVETTNTRLMRQYLRDAQEQAMFMAISHRAGQGKSASIGLHKADDVEGATYVLECEESWSHKLFLQKLATTLGIDVEGLTVSAMTDEIVAFFKRRSVQVNPLLVLDEANKLKPSSLRLIIPLYNKLKGQLGLVIVGADDLERHIKAGVRRDVRGYDELDSRLGRKFLHLFGATLVDVQLICTANGLTDAGAQTDIWQSLRPIRISDKDTGHYHEVVQDDLRRLERAVLNYRLKQSRNLNA